MDLTSYLIMMAVSSAVCTLLTVLLVRREEKARPAAALAILPLGWVFGFLGAKLFYIILEFPFIIGQGLGNILTHTSIEELSYYGGVAGVTLAACVTGKLAHVRPVRFLNLFAPAGALMAALARFAEGFLGMLGLGDYVENGFFPLALVNEWDEAYLAVFLFEGCFSLLVMVWAFLHRQEKDGFVRTLFLLCLSQMFFESLRNQSIAWLFVRCEQLLCFVYVFAVLIAWSLRARKKQHRRWFVPVIIGVVVALLTIAEEFALDKTNISHLITYACMVLGLAVLAVTEHKVYRWLQAS